MVNTWNSNDQRAGPILKKVLEAAHFRNSWSTFQCFQILADWKKTMVVAQNWSRKLWPVAWPQYLHTGDTRAIRPCSSHAWRNLQRISMTHIPPGSVEIFRLSGTGPKGSFGSHVSVNAKNHLREPSILFGSSGQFHSVSFTFFWTVLAFSSCEFPYWLKGKFDTPWICFLKKTIFSILVFFSQTNPLRRRSNFQDTTQELTPQGTRSASVQAWFGINKATNPLKAQDAWFPHGNPIKPQYHNEIIISIVIP